MHIQTFENYQFKTYKEALESEMEEIESCRNFFGSKDVMQIFPEYVFGLTLKMIFASIL
jgi:hypothetical protein